MVVCPLMVQRSGMQSYEGIECLFRPLAPSGMPPRVLLTPTDTMVHPHGRALGEALVGGFGWGFAN